MITYYLAHPFDSRHILREWELYLESTFGVEVVNPFYDIERQDIEAIDANRVGRYEVCPDAIVQRDLDAISKVDGIIAIVDGSVSYGTIMEIVYAYLYGKTIHIICTNGHINHPWLRYHADHLYESLAAFEAFNFPTDRDEAQCSVP